MPIISLDEAGHTGPNLLDPEQPVLAIATHDFTDDEAKRLKSDFFGGVKAQSLKFSKLARRPATQRFVLSFLKEMKGAHSSRIACYAIHKPFNLVCKLVDHVVEESFHRMGYNLYEKGGNLALCNAIYLIVESSGGADYLRRFLHAISELFLSETLSGAAMLDAVLEEKTGLIDGPERCGPLAEILKIPHGALRTIDPAHLARLTRDDLMLNFALAVFLMSTWSSRHGGGLELVHDESVVMLRKLDEWTKIVSPSVPEAFVGYDRRTWKFPIGVKITRFEKDESWAGLQLADLMAGSLAAALPFFWNLKENPDSFESRLLDVMEGWPLENHISPQMKFTPKDLGTDGPLYADPLEHWQHILRKDAGKQ